MRRRERPLRWMPPFRTLYKGRNVAYVDPDGLLRRPEILALLRDHASELEGFMPRSLVLEIADEGETPSAERRAGDDRKTDIDQEQRAAPQRGDIRFRRR